MLLQITECSRLQAFGLSLQMVFVTAVARAPATPTGPGGPDGHLANTQNVIRKAVKNEKSLCLELTVVLAGCYL
jgi:hypothetical protein